MPPGAHASTNSGAGRCGERCPRRRGRRSMPGTESRGHYHGWRHIADLLEGTTRVRALPDFAGARSRRDRSRDLLSRCGLRHRPHRQRAAERRLAADSSAPVRRIWPDPAAEAMIQATAAHAPSDDAATTADARLDLAVLGAPRPVYEAYAAAIRREYAAISRSGMAVRPRGRARPLPRPARPLPDPPLSRPLRNSRPDQPRGRGGHAPGRSYRRGGVRDALATENRSAACARRHRRAIRSESAAFMQASCTAIRRC